MPTPANLLFLLSDNHNRALAGCYGHPQATTPNLDRIAARGVRFANAYAASPLCCPARAALATGRFPHQTGYWDNAIVYDGRVPSWAHRLRAQGHAVTSIGKLHFRSAEDDNGFSQELLPMHILGGAVILRSIFAIKEFDTILTMTEGGPNWATETMNMNIYFNAFGYGHTAIAATKGVLFFTFLLAIQFTLVKYRERQWSY